MVSMMDVEQSKKGQFCDMSRPKVTPSVDSELAKKAFKLNLKSFATSAEDSSTSVQFVRQQAVSQQESTEIRSPLSPNSGKWRTMMMMISCVTTKGRALIVNEDYCHCPSHIHSPQLCQLWPITTT